MRKRKHRVIIDTNLWISFLINGDYSRLDKILDNRRIILLYSQELIDEFVEVAKRPKFKKYLTLDDIREILLKIATRAEFIEVESKVDISKDPKDNFLLELAKDGKATHLLTGDKYLLSIEKFFRTSILSITEYLKSI